jgi:hypothetical protein
LKDPVKLMQLCEQGVANPAFQPKTDGTTFCNQFADFVAKGMGCNQLEGLMADQIYELMIANPSMWRPILDMNKSPSSSGASILAHGGNLIFGIMDSKHLGQAHGHLCVVIPGDCVFSSHWNALSPLCANVGEENFIGKPMSYAFKTIPNFYIWTPSL